LGKNLRKFIIGITWSPKNQLSSYWNNLIFTAKFPGKPNAHNKFQLDEIWQALGAF
jgi:hypothetical protein